MPYKDNPIQQLKKVIDRSTSEIHNFTRKPTDFTRNRKLNAKTTIQVTLNMQGNSLNAELLNAFPDINDRMTASAYEQAKDKLKPELFEYILHNYNKTMTAPKLLNGKYRVYAIDGSDFNPPYNPDSAFVMHSSVGRPKKNSEYCKPYSLVHANLLYDIENRTYEDCLLESKSSGNERDAAITMLKRLDSTNPYIVIMDRGYDGFNMVETLNRLENCKYIIRTKVSKGGIKEISELPNEECDTDMGFDVVTSNKFYKDNHKNMPYLHLINSPRKHHKKYFSPNTKNQRWDFEWRCNVKCRVVKFRINDSNSNKEEWEVLLTNLNRFEFSISNMRGLYNKRWGIETSFRELKYALGAVNFHSKKDDFVKMEILSHLIMFNVTSRNIAQVTVPQVNHKHTYAIDFRMACLLTHKYFAIYSKDNPNKLFIEILSYINPVRPNRQDKRNIKTRSAVWFVYRVA